MAFQNKNCTPKVREEPATQKIKLGGNPDSLDAETIAWHFHRLDREHEDWGWDKLKAGQWRGILQELVSLEGLTWAEIKSQAGGKTNGTNHHSIPISEFVS